MTVDENNTRTSRELGSKEIPQCLTAFGNVEEFRNRQIFRYRLHNRGRRKTIQIGSSLKVFNDVGSLTCCIALALYKIGVEFGEIFQIPLKWTIEQK